ncbi:MAG: hypothetical protein H7Z18_09865 [Methylophilaceae bacterium]|nr:hypothetical protein [Methylophilaceae bacterium]
MFKLANGLRNAINLDNLTWCVTQVGARTEFLFTKIPSKNGLEASLMLDSELEQTIHLYLINRGVLINPISQYVIGLPRYYWE